MQILLIDCGSAHLGQLETVCARHDLTVIPAQEFSTLISERAEAIEEYDALIITGDFDKERATSSNDYRALLRLVTSFDRPLLGIGFGFEIVCYGLGAQLQKIGVLDSGADVITPTDDGAKVFQGTDPMHVIDVDRWSVDAEDIPKILQILATSEFGVEAVKHKTKPIYGLQLFPEQFTYPSDGKLVLENILASFKKMTKPSRLAVAAQ
jgi:anthranilate/para-aminobenzoate synthase component II